MLTLLLGCAILDSDPSTPFEPMPLEPTPSEPQGEVEAPPAIPPSDDPVVTVSDEAAASPDLVAAVRSRARDLMRCTDGHEVEGAVEVGFSVYDGAVESVYIVSNTTGVSAISTCMHEAVKTWNALPAGEGDFSVKVPVP